MIEDVDIYMRDGTVHKAVPLDGGGTSLDPEDPNRGRRELHATVNDEFFCVYQDEVEKILDQDGNDVTDRYVI